MRREVVTLEASESLGLADDIKTDCLRFLARVLNILAIREQLLPLLD